MPTQTIAVLPQTNPYPQILTGHCSRALSALGRPRFTKTKGRFCVETGEGWSVQEVKSDAKDSQLYTLVTPNPLPH